MFSFGSFMALFMFESLINFKLISVYDVSNKRTYFHYLKCGYQVFPTPFMEVSFIHFMFSFLIGQEKIHPEQ